MGELTSALDQSAAEFPAQTRPTTNFPILIRKVPQMADNSQVYEAITKIDNVNYPVLVPNLKGLENALKCGVQEIAVFVAASETFSK